MNTLKKLMITLLALCLLLTAAPALAEGADIQCSGMPQEVIAFFAQSQFGGAFVGPNGGVLVENTPGGSFYFAVLQREGHNTLYGFEKKNGKYQYWLVTDAAIPQGEGYISLAHLYGEHYFLLDDPLWLNDAVDLIFTRIDDEEQADSAVLFEVNSAGQWHVRVVSFHACWDEAFLNEDSVFYNLDEGDTRETVYGVVERNLRYFSWADFPKSIKDAREKLTNPPAIPTGELTAQRIKFEGGQKFPVYSGPGETYQRLGNGKAAVSTNDWIQVFGSENGYILIQYDLSSDQMRVGWIDQSALPRGASVSPLRFSYQDAHTAAAAVLTDDPFVSQTPVRSLKGGQAVKWLAVSGNWVYVEIADQGAPIRGFVQRSALTLDDQEALPQAPQGTAYEASFENGIYTAHAQVSMGENNEISASVRVTGPAFWAESGADAITGYQLYANNVPLAVLSTGSKNAGAWDYTFTASAALPQKATLLGLCPVHARSGLVAGEMITLSLESGKAPVIPGNLAVVNNPNPAERLHLRRSATAASASLGKYYNGTQATLIVGGTEYEGFSHVRIGDAEGYMMTEYLAFGAAAGQVNDARPVVTVQNAAGTGLNLRTAPSTDGAVLQLLKNGVQVTVMGLTEDWLHVSFNGQTGYIAATGVAPRLSYDLYTGGGSTGSARKARINGSCSVYSQPITDELLKKTNGDTDPYIMGILSPGDVVTVYQTKDRFAQVDYGGSRYWVSLSALSYLSDAASAESSYQLARMVGTDSVYTTPEDLPFDAGDPRGNIDGYCSDGTEVKVYQVKNGFARIRQNPAGWVHLTSIEFIEN